MKKKLYSALFIAFCTLPLHSMKAPDPLPEQQFPQQKDILTPPQSQQQISVENTDGDDDYTCTGNDFCMLISALKHFVYDN